MSKRHTTKHHHKPPHTIKNHHTPPQTTTHHHKPPHTIKDYHTPPQTTTHYHKPPHTKTNHHTPPQTTTHHHKPLHTTTNHHTPPHINNSCILPRLPGSFPNYLDAPQHPYCFNILTMVFHNLPESQATLVYILSIYLDISSPLKLKFDHNLYYSLAGPKEPRSRVKCYKKHCCHFILGLRNINN